MSTIALPKSDAAKGLDDIRRGLAAWRTWTTFAWNDVLRRYRRTRIGQFWLTISMGLMILGLGIVYSALFRIDTAVYLPYVTVSFILWTFIASFLNESCHAFIESEGLIKHTDLPRSTHVFRVSLRGSIVLAHNIVIIPLVFLALGLAPGASVLWLLVTLPLLIANLFWMGYALAILCARYRDIPQIVQSLVQVLFFVTPVMFKPSQIADGPIWILQLNPFAALLDIVREPVLGNAPSVHALAYAAVMLVVGWAFLLRFAGRFAPRVVYWV
jgi:ABC-type polysaccharide/polyol phosphate export permease